MKTKKAELSIFLMRKKRIELEKRKKKEAEEQK